MEVVNNISQFIRNATDEPDIQVTAHGVSFSLVKVNISTGDQHVFHLKNDEVRVPGDLEQAFKGTIKDGKLQVGTQLDE